MHENALKFEQKRHGKIFCNYTELLHGKIFELEASPVEGQSLPQKDQQGKAKKLRKPKKP